MQIEAVIFDMDGLLLDTEALAREVWPRAASACGFDLSDDIFLSLVGRTRIDSDAILRHRFGSKFSPDVFYRECRTLWDSAIEERGLSVKACVVELLDFLESRRLPTGVATSTVRASAERSLEIAGLASRIRCIATGDEVAQGKPAPDIFLLAASRLGIPSPRCLVLEDSHNGIRAAHASGAIPVMVPDLIAPDAEMEALSVGIFPTLCGVRSWLAREVG